MDTTDKKEISTPKMDLDNPAKRVIGLVVITGLLLLASTYIVKIKTK